MGGIDGHAGAAGDIEFSMRASILIRDGDMGISIRDRQARASGD